VEGTLQELIEAQDMNALLRAVDGLCERHSWGELIDLAEACEEALERGKQLWPIAEHIDYRLALEAPGDYAAQVISPDVGRFAHGPLTEVAASTHTWEELAPHLDEPHIAAYVAQERVLRGELLAGDERAHPEILEMPLELEDWEPTYALATFRSTYAEIAEPWDPKDSLHEQQVTRTDAADDTELVDALLELVHPWVAESNGAARAVVVDADAISAASSLTLERLRMGRLEPAEAVQRMAWAAASGGAHGRRRGAAFGRFLARHTLAVIADLEWPAQAGDIEAALNDLEWYRWDEGAEEEEGWVLRLAVENRSQGWSAAIAATDLRNE
jgi:Family of unknown function (DUF6183)